ncbi:ankyrin repeat-containing domain protein [Obelidium mucronatum]|nr:ankyrin repeat-containing domain protein [Obelidium mucronatum]
MIAENDLLTPPSSPPTDQQLETTLHPHTLGASINKETYRRFVGLLADCVLQEAFNKDSSLRFKFGLLCADASKNTSTSDILDKLKDTNVRASFQELLAFVNASSGSSPTSATGTALSDDPSFKAVSEFLGIVIQEISPFVPFGFLLVSIGKLGYKLVNAGNELQTEIAEFAVTIHHTTVAINTHLKSEIRADDVRKLMAESLDRLVQCAVDYFDFYLSNYCVNGLKNKLRNFNLLKTIKLREAFGEIQKTFERESRDLNVSISVVLVRGISNIKTILREIEERRAADARILIEGQNTLVDGQKKILHSLRVLDNRLANRTEVPSDADIVHKYPLEIQVLNFKENDPLFVEVEENYRAEQLIKEIESDPQFSKAAPPSKTDHKQTAPSEKLMLFHRTAENSRIHLTDNNLLKPKLAKSKNPYEEAVFDFATFIEIVVYEGGSSQQLPPITIRLSDFTLRSLKQKINERIEGLQDTPYKILNSAGLALDNSDLVEEFAKKGDAFHVYRSSSGLPCVPAAPPVRPGPPRRAESVYVTVAPETPATSIPQNESCLRNWLQPVDFSDDLEVYASQFVEGTRQWTLRHIWIWALEADQSTKVMWLYGGAGTGKSLLSYAVVTMYPPKEFIVGARFFCRHNDARKSDPAAIVKSIVWDLVQALGDTFPAFRKHVEKQMDEDLYQIKYYSKSILADPFKAFQVLIVDGLKNCDTTSFKKTVLIVIDALDECNFETRVSFLKVLTNLSSLLPTCFKVFVTARPEKDIYDCLTKLRVFELEPSRKENLEDIHLVVEARLRKMWSIKGILPDEVAGCIADLVNKSEGLFIYVRVICEFLEQSKITIQEAREQIAGYASGPDEVYALIVKRVKDAVGIEKFKIVVDLLGCIIFANEPLDIPVLSFMLSLELEETQFFLDQLRSILKISGGRVAAIHKSFKDFFSTPERSKQFFIHFETANTLLANGCLVAVSSMLETLANFPKRELINFLAGKPSVISLGNLSVASSEFLAQYSVRNWAAHLDTTPNVLPSNLADFSVSYGTIAMTCAAVAGRESLFVKLLAAGASVEDFLKLKYYLSPALYEAAKRGQSVVCEVLLKSNLVDVNCRGYSPSPKSGETNNTPLIAAIDAKSLSTVIVLVEFGADLSLTDGFGHTPLTYASGEIETWFFQHKRNQKTAKLKKQLSPFHLAVVDRDFPSVQALFDQVENAFAPNESDGCTALHYAAEFYDKAVFWFLVSRFSGSNIFNLKNFLNQTPLHLSALNGHVDAARLLLDSGASVNGENAVIDTPLHGAARNGHIDAVRLLLDSGASVNAESYEDWTPLHDAALNGHVDAARLLLGSGASVNAENGGKWTPLHYAAQNGHGDAVRLLLDSGASVNAENADKNTPLHGAAWNGHVDAVRLLLDSGASVNAENAIIYTPLHNAAQNGHVNVVRLLLHSGASVNAEYKWKQADQEPLHLAAQNGNLDAVGLLLDSGASVNAENGGAQVSMLRLLKSRCPFTLLLRMDTLMLLCCFLSVVQVSMPRMLTRTRPFTLLLGMDTLMLLGCFSTVAQVSMLKIVASGRPFTLLRIRDTLMLLGCFSTMAQVSMLKMVASGRPFTLLRRRDTLMLLGCFSTVAQVSMLKMVVASRQWCKCQC